MGVSYMRKEGTTFEGIFQLLLLVIILEPYPSRKAIYFRYPRIFKSFSISAERFISFGKGRTLQLFFPFSFYTFVIVRQLADILDESVFAFILGWNLANFN